MGRAFPWEVVRQINFPVFSIDDRETEGREVGVWNCSSHCDLRWFAGTPPTWSRKAAKSGTIVTLLKSG